MMSSKEYDQYDDNQQHQRRKEKKRRSTPRRLTKNTRSSREKEPAERQQQYRQPIQRRYHHNADYAELRMNRSLPNLDFSRDYERNNHDYERTSRNHRRHDDHLLGEQRKGRGKSEQGHRRRPSMNIRREDCRGRDVIVTIRSEERVSAEDRIRRVPKKNSSSRRLKPDEPSEECHLSRRHHSEQRLRTDDERHPRVDERLARSRRSKSTRRFSTGDDTRQRSTGRLPDDAVPREEIDQLLERYLSTRRANFTTERKQPQRHHKEHIIKTDKELSSFLQDCFEKGFSDCGKTDAETIAYLQRCFEEEFYGRKEFYERHSSRKENKQSDEAIAMKLEVLFEKEFKRYMGRHGQGIESSRQRRHQETADAVFAQYLQKAFEQEFARHVQQNIERRETLAREFESEPRGGSRILGGERRLKKYPQQQHQSRFNSF